MKKYAIHIVVSAILLPWFSSGQNIGPSPIPKSSLILTISDDTSKVDSLLQTIKKYRRSNQNGCYKAAFDILNFCTHLEFYGGVSASRDLLGLLEEDQTNYEKALVHYHAALKAETHQKSKLGEAKFLNIIGIIHKVQGNYHYALDYFGKSLEIRRKLKDDASVAKALNNIGNVLDLQGNQSRALSAYLESIALKKQLKDTLSLAKSYQNIGGYFIRISDTSNASFYLEKALEYYQAINYPEGISATWNNFGTLYLNQGRNKDAQGAFNKALQHLPAKDFPAERADLSHNIGLLLFKEGALKKARSNYYESIELERLLGDTAGIVITMLNLAQLESSVGNRANAIIHLDSAWNLAKVIRDTIGMSKASKKLAEYYSSKNPNKAIEYFALHIGLDSALDHKNNIERSEAAHSRYRSQEYEKELALLEKQKEAEMYASERRQFLYLSIVLGLIIIILVGIGVWIHRWTQMKHRNREQELLYEAERRETMRIGSYIHDSVGVMLAQMRMIWESWEPDLKHKNDEYQSLLVLLKQISSIIREKVMILVSETLVKEGLIPALEELFESNNRISKINFEGVYGGKLGDMDHRMQHDCFRIVQELTHNAMKHSKATKVNVAVKVMNGTLNIDVTDNGAGFDQSKATKHVGAGLRMIEKKISELNGTMQINTEDGTEVIVVIPLRTHKASSRFFSLPYLFFQ